MITEMDRIKMILSEGAKKGLVLSKFIDTQINEFKGSDTFKEMIEGSRYFKNEGDIKNKRRMFINEIGQEEVTPLSFLFLDLMLLFCFLYFFNHF